MVIRRENMTGRREVLSATVGKTSLFVKEIMEKYGQGEKYIFDPVSFVYLFPDIQKEEPEQKAPEEERAREYVIREKETLKLVTHSERSREFITRVVERASMPGPEELLYRKSWKAQLISRVKVILQDCREFEKIFLFETMSGQQAIHPFQEELHTLEQNLEKWREADLPHERQYQKQSVESAARLLTQRRLLEQQEDYQLFLQVRKLFMQQLQGEWEDTDPTGQMSADNAAASPTEEQKQNIVHHIFDNIHRILEQASKGEPYAQEHPELPDVSKQPILPDVSEQLILPDASKQLIQPDVSEQQIQPDTSEQLMLPDVSEELDYPAGETVEHREAEHADGNEIRQLRLLSRLLKESDVASLVGRLQPSEWEDILEKTSQELSVEQLLQIQWRLVGRMSPEEVEVSLAQDSVSKQQFSDGEALIFYNQVQEYVEKTYEQRPSVHSLIKQVIRDRQWVDLIRSRMDKILEGAGVQSYGQTVEWLSEQSLGPAAERTSGQNNGPAAERTNGQNNGPAAERTGGQNNGQPVGRLSRQSSERTDEQISGRMDVAGGVDRTVIQQVQALSALLQESDVLSLIRRLDEGEWQDFPDFSENWSLPELYQLQWKLVEKMYPVEWEHVRERLEKNQKLEKLLPNGPERDIILRQVEKRIKNSDNSGVLSRTLLKSNSEGYEIIQLLYDRVHNLAERDSSYEISENPSGINTLLVRKFGLETLVDRTVDTEWGEFLNQTSDLSRQEQVIRAERFLVHHIGFRELDQVQGQVSRREKEFSLLSQHAQDEIQQTLMQIQEQRARQIIDHSFYRLLDSRLPDEGREMDWLPGIVRKVGITTLVERMDSQEWNQLRTYLEDPENSPEKSDQIEQLLIDKLEPAELKYAEHSADGMSGYSGWKQDGQSLSFMDGIPLRPKAGTDHKRLLRHLQGIRTLEQLQRLVSLDGGREETIQENVRSIMRETAKMPMREAAEMPMRETVEMTMRETVKGPVKEGVRETLQEAVRKITRETAEGTLQEVVKDMSKENGRETIQELQETVREMSQEAVREAQYDVQEIADGIRLILRESAAGSIQEGRGGPADHIPGILERVSRRILFRDDTRDSGLLQMLNSWEYPLQEEVFRERQSAETRNSVRQSAETEIFRINEPGWNLKGTDEPITESMSRTLRLQVDRALEAAGNIPRLERERELTQRPSETRVSSGQLQFYQANTQKVQKQQALQQEQLNQLRDQTVLQTEQIRKMEKQQKVLMEQLEEPRESPEEIERRTIQRLQDQLRLERMRRGLA